MRVKQKNLRVFHLHVDSEEEFINYFNKNKIILKEFFLLIDGKVTQEVKSSLEKEQICFKDISQCNLRLGNVKHEISADQQSVEKNEKKSIKTKDDIAPLSMKVYDRPIRSGEEINEASSVSVFGRVNSGAKLFCSQNLSIYGVVDGLVQCDGDYMIFFGLSQRGNIIFNGEIIEKDLIKDGVLQKLYKKGMTVKIEDVF